MEVLALLLLMVILVIAVYLYARSRAVAEARRLFEEWKQREYESVKRSLEDAIRKEYEVRLQQWIQENEKRIREEAIQRSLATILGKVGEELAPLIIFANYGIEPKDLRHIGSPVDYIAFKGYSNDKKVEEIIFFEIKTGKTARLADSEKSVRDAIANNRVRYVVINVREELEKLRAELAKQHIEEKTGQMLDEG